MEVINAYPSSMMVKAYDGTDIHKYTFPHRKTYGC